MGFCTEDPGVAADVAEIIEAIDEDEDDNAAKLGRRFQIGGPSQSAADQTARTKRRTQRISLLMAKVSSQQNGQKLRPREFMRRINSYGKTF